MPQYLGYKYKISLALDKRIYQVNIFPISPKIYVVGTH